MARCRCCPSRRSGETGRSIWWIGNRCTRWYPPRFTPKLRKMRHPVENKAIEMAAFGDPRMPAAGKAGLERSANPDLRLAAERGFDFGRLPFSRQEVEGIAALFPKRNRTYLGADATEEHAKALGKDVRYIHFATHGLLDERFPLDSALVLSVLGQVQPGKDNGLLQAWEIFEQVRLDADLVTLSACNTGLGQEVKGEGLIGLTRAFQYAGARSILASLWSVDDFRTMQLMQRFYTDLRSGKSKDEALRSAQLQLAHSQSSSAPYYWAGFSLIGDWKLFRSKYSRVRKTPHPTSSDSDFYGSRLTLAS